MAHNVYFIKKNIPVAIQARCPLISLESQVFPLLLGNSPRLWAWEVLPLVAMCEVYKMAATASLFPQSVGRLIPGERIVSVSPAVPPCAICR